MRKMNFAALFVSGFVLWGCLAIAQPVDDEAMLARAAALTKLAAAVESAVQFKDAPEDLSEAELLAFATRHDPGLLDAFGGFVVRVRRQGRLSSVLLCTVDRQTALMEDAGCTAKSDLHLWRAVPAAGCDFQLSLPVVCARP